MLLPKMHFFVVYGIIKVKLLKILGGNTEKFLETY